MTQKQRVLEYLKSGKALNRIIAWQEIGSLEVCARICELRQEGYPIITEMVPVTNRYGEQVKVAKWTLSQ